MSWESAVRCCLVLVLVVLCSAGVWAQLIPLNVVPSSLEDFGGIWEMAEGLPLVLYSCMDSKGKWVATVKDKTNDQEILQLSGVINSDQLSIDNFVVGTCRPPLVPLEYVVDYRDEQAWPLWPGMKIVFLGPPDLNGTVILTVHTPDEVLWEQEISSGDNATWQTDFNMFITVPSEQIYLSFSGSYSKLIYLDFVRTGGHLFAEIASTGTASFIWVGCNPTPMDYGGFGRFFPVADEATSVQCGDYSSLWIGSWSLVSATHQFDLSWWVCPSANGFVSSFGYLNDIFAGLPYFLSDSATINGPSINGTFSPYSDPSSLGSFVFKMSNSDDSFEGFVYYQFYTIPVVGSLLSNSVPFSYLCSPFYRYAGLWLEQTYLSNMYLCVKDQQVVGSFLGKSKEITGSFIYNESSTQFKWILNATVVDTRTGENKQLKLFLERNVRQQYMYKILSPHIDEDNPEGRIFAESSHKTVNNCSEVALIWGVFKEEIYDSYLYLCSGPGNSIYGSLNNWKYTFNGKLTDINEFQGVMSDGPTKFTWVFNTNDVVTAEYVDTNGVSVKTTMYRTSDDVSLSQCNGTILATGFVGTWQVGDSIVYFCQVFGYVVEGKMDSYYFKGVMTNGKLNGTYTKEDDQSSGVWTAAIDISETDLVLIMDNNITLLGIKISRASNAFQCGSWKTIWKTIFGVNDYSLFGGCFSICLENTGNNFKILFYNSDMQGNGTMNPFTGELTGFLFGYGEEYQFIMTVSTSDSVFVEIFNKGMRIKHNTYVACDSIPFYQEVPPKFSCTSEFYPNTLYLDSSSSLGLTNTSTFLKSGGDISFDGKYSIASTGDTVVILKDVNGAWRDPFYLYLSMPDTDKQNSTLYPIFGGIPVSITNTHAFVIDGDMVSVYANIGDNWVWSDFLQPPISNCTPFYLLKSTSNDTEPSYLAVNWFSTQSYVFLLALYDISDGKVNPVPFEHLRQRQNDYILAVSLSSKWLMYTVMQFLTLSISVDICVLPSYEGAAVVCSAKKLGNADHYNVQELGLGFSLAVSNEYFFVGYPSSQGHTGSVYVYTYQNPTWRLTQILNPPDSGYHQSFGSALAVRGNSLLVLKAKDNQAQPFSLAFFVYSLEDGLWGPTAKLVSQSWPSKLQKSDQSQKRQWTTSPEIDPLAPSMIWAMSGNSTIFMSSPQLDTLYQAWYSCFPGYWGKNCTLECPCQQNSICTSDITGFTCKCQNSTWGVYCENTCPKCNGAPCDSRTGYCLCNEQQYGPNCFPCTCVKGTCSNGTMGTGECSCFEGYTGRNCDANLYIVIGSSVVGGILLILIPILIVICVRQRRYNKTLAELPEEVRWFIDSDRISTETGWNTKLGKDFLSKNVDDDKRYKKKLNEFLKQLDGSSISIKKAYAIFNETLLNNFLGFRKIFSQRHNERPDLFKKVYPPHEKRDWVSHNFELRIRKQHWNTGLELPILPVIHGTDAVVAKSICSSGFAALSSLDAGFYGKGIYFTSSCLYAIPYYATKSKPTILICLVTPGNILPVIENKEDVNSFLGQPINSGYQGHYVLTTKEGSVAADTDKHFYDELVVPSESQILPIFMIKINKASLQTLIAQFQRKIAV